MNERRNAHGKVKPLKTLKNKKKERNSGVDQRDSRMPEDKVNQILREHNLKEHERMLKQGRDSKHLLVLDTKNEKYMMVIPF